MIGDALVSTSELPERWRWVELGELATFINGDRGKNYPSKSDRVDHGVPFINTGHIDPTGRLSSERMDFITRERFEKLGSGKVKPGDIVYCLRGSTIGKIARNEFPEGAIASSLVIIRTSDSALQQLIYYFLASPVGQTLAKKFDNGSAQPNLSATIISRYPIPLPPQAEVVQICQLLSALDDKIELNRRMNETLEAIARAIFKDWFVDFGPTRAKAEGRTPYLAPEIWDLFPDALDDEDKPAGWEYSEIGKEVHAVGGSTPSTKEPAFWQGGKHHWATPKDLSKLAAPVLLNTDRRITDPGVSKISSGLLPVGTVLLSSRAPIGYLAIAEVPTAVNQGFIAMVCCKRLPNVFVLFWCHENLDYIKGISGGSTFAEISKKAFRPIPVIVPSESILATYEGLVRPLYDRIVSNVKESDSLAQTRDLLLPKLMSGEIRLRDKGEVIREVA